MKTVGTLLAFVVAVSLVGRPATARAIEVGSPFPLLQLPRLEDGRRGSVADYRGEKLVLHVFASW